MTTVRFAKMHGAGNDVVIVDCLQGDPVSDWEAFARFALNRRLGIGGDQLLLVQRSHVAEFQMRIHNPDGSRAEMCANGIRTFAKFLRDRGHTRADRITIETLAGIVAPRWLGDDRFETEQTPPRFAPAEIPTTLGAGASGPLLQVPLQVGTQTLDVSLVSMGNPHCVIFVDDPQTTPVTTLGPQIENHPAFPRRTNVEFIAVRSPGLIEQRTWERGTGETLACGSGACASGVAAMLVGKAESQVTIRLRGGDLEVRWPDRNGPVWLSGPAAHVFDGEISFP